MKTLRGTLYSMQSMPNPEQNLTNYLQILQKGTNLNRELVKVSSLPKRETNCHPLQETLLGMKLYQQRLYEELFSLTTMGSTQLWPIFKTLHTCISQT